MMASVRSNRPKPQEGAGTAQQVVEVPLHAMAMEVMENKEGGDLKDLTERRFLSSSKVLEM